MPLTSSKSSGPASRSRPNLITTLWGRSDPSRAADAADATAKALGLGFGTNHPAAHWARDVAAKGRTMLEAK